MLREYLLLVAGGRTQAVFAIWRDATPIGGLLWIPIVRRRLAGPGRSQRRSASGH